jgi:hypothetical protein
MSLNGRLAATLIALTFLGCSAGQTTGVLNGEAAAFGEAVSSGGIRTEVIRDPTLNNMGAFQVPVPAMWHFLGVVDQGGSCVGISTAVFRATSPDGLSFSEQMPMLGWTWGTGIDAKVPPKNGCLPLKGAMSARDFLKYMSAMLNVDYVADDPLPAAMQANVQKSLDDAELRCAVRRHAPVAAQTDRATGEGDCSLQEWHLRNEGAAGDQSDLHGAI